MGMPTCPVCGEECNEFYVSDYGLEIMGCENCIHTESAAERAAEDDLDNLIEHKWERWEER